MQKHKIIALLSVIIVMLSACSKDTAQPQHQIETTPASKFAVVGTSSSCDIAPKELTLAGKTYHLSEKPTAEEGPMKLAYIKCEKGTFTMGDTDDDFTVLSAGKSSDIYLLGGRTEKELRQFYSLDDKTTFKKLIKEDILSVTISTGVKDPVSGVIDAEADIYTLVNLMNKVTHLTGNATADYYRLVKLNMKDGSVKALEFGGSGQFFKVLDSGVFFKLEPPENHKILNKLIDQVEKDYQLKH